MRALNFKKCPHNSNQRKGLSVCRQSIKGYLRLKYVLDNKIEMAENIVCVLKMTNEARSIPLHSIQPPPPPPGAVMQTCFIRHGKIQMKENAITDCRIDFSGDLS